MKDTTSIKLPQDVICSSATIKDDSDAEDAEKLTKSFLESRLRQDDFASLETELMRRFPLAKERQIVKKRIRRKGCPKNLTLSNTKKRALGLFTIEREGLQYKDLLPLHEMWKSYMDGFLNLSRLRHMGFNGDVKSPQFAEIGQSLYKADYHGAFVSVTKSTAPSLVGIGGILIFETKNTLKLLGKDNITRCVPKYPCEFEMVVGHLRLSFLGKNFIVKSAERSSKKKRGTKLFQL